MTRGRLAIASASGLICRILPAASLNVCSAGLTKQAFTVRKTHDTRKSFYEWISRHTVTKAFVDVPFQDVQISGLHGELCKNAYFLPICFAEARQWRYQEKGLTAPRDTLKMRLAVSTRPSEPVVIFLS